MKSDESVIETALPQIDIKRGSIGITNLLQDSIDEGSLKGNPRAYLTERQELRDIADEYLLAEQKLLETGKLPITIDNNCLLSMQNSRDTSIVLRLFKTACLSYAPSDITYRDKIMSRHFIIGLRRMLIDKVTQYMTNSGLFQEGSIYPRRYYDDLILEQELANKQSQRIKEMSISIENRTNINDLLNSKIPFGMPTARSTVKGAYVGKNSVPNFAQNNMSNPHLASDETNAGSGMSASILMMPQILPLNRDSGVKMKNSIFKPKDIKGMSSYNFGSPNDLSMDMDSRELSKLTLDKQKAMEKARHARNRTIDIPGSHSAVDDIKAKQIDGNPNLITPRVFKMSRNNFGNKSLSNQGGKLKISIPGKRLADNSETQFDGVNSLTAELSHLPRIHS